MAREEKEFVVRLNTESFVRRVKAQKMDIGKDDYVFLNPVPGSPTHWEALVAFPRKQVEYAIEASQWTEPDETT